MDHQKVMSLCLTADRIDMSSTQLLVQESYTLRACKTTIVQKHRALCVGTDKSEQDTTQDKALCTSYVSRQSRCPSGTTRRHNWILPDRWTDTYTHGRMHTHTHNLCKATCKKPSTHTYSWCTPGLKTGQ